MGAYRAGDLLTVPGLLSLARVPLGLLFPFVVDPWASLLVVATAGLSDMLDGWYARRFGKETATGALLDPLSDKFFVAAMVLTLLLRGALPWWAVPVLAAREIGEVPLVLWLLATRKTRRARGDHPHSSIAGKLTTCLQFATLSSAMIGIPHKIVRRPRPAFHPAPRNACPVGSLSINPFPIRKTPRLSTVRP